MVKPIDFSRNYYILESIRQTIECLRPSPGTEATAKVEKRLGGKVETLAHPSVSGGRFHLVSESFKVKVFGRRREEKMPETAAMPGNTGHSAQAQAAGFES